MYEYKRQTRGLGTDNASPGMQLALDYRAGARTLAQVRNICMNVSPDRYHTDYSECRWFLDPEAQCARENRRVCSEQEVREQCFLTPQDLRSTGCISYLGNMTAAEIEAIQGGPAVDTSLRRATTGVIAQYRERVAEAAENLVRKLREVDPNVQALQRSIIAAGCPLARYGADGRWGSETEAGVRCLAQSHGWVSIVQQWPWISQRIQVPAGQAGPTTTDVAKAPAAQASEVQTASIGPSFDIFGLPPWASWTVAGLGLASIIALGAYLTRNRGR